MSLEDLLYDIGLLVERLYTNTVNAVKGFLLPTPSERLPSWISRRLLKGKKFTPHEVVSLYLQVFFLGYLVLSFGLVFLSFNYWYFIASFLFYFLGLRYILCRYSGFLIDENAYRSFYYGISTISFVALLGYLLLRQVNIGIQYYYIYVGIIVLVVILFRHYFKSRYGRDYTYGIVEEVKNDLVRVFVHDDIAANVKPGRYWVPAVPDAKPGRVVKLLLEDRTMRGAVPSRILEVYLEDLDQSSQTETEPKDETE